MWKERRRREGKKRQRKKKGTRVPSFSKGATHTHNKHKTQQKPIEKHNKKPPQERRRNHVTNSSSSFFLSPFFFFDSFHLPPFAFWLVPFSSFWPVRFSSSSASGVVARPRELEKGWKEILFLLCRVVQLLSNQLRVLFFFPAAEEEIVGKRHPVWPNRKKTKKSWTNKI